MNNSKMLSKIKLINSSCQKFEKIEFSLEINTPQLNPFRSGNMALDAVFTLPSGKVMKVPGFYFQDFELREHQLFPLSEQGNWRLRFASPEAGEHHGKFILEIDGRIAEQVEVPSFTVEDSTSHGAIRQSQQSPYYLEFEDGTPYFPIGQNLAFLTEKAKSIPVHPAEDRYSPMASESLPWDTAYLKWMQRMSENGANWARVWMGPTFCLEDGEPWDFSQEKAWRLDYVLEHAEKLGMYICLCFDYIRNFFYRMEGISTTNFFSGYNTAWRKLLESEGCHKTDDFFKCPAVTEMMRDKIRYIIARWGYSLQIFSWELWNEIGCVNAEGRNILAWSKSLTQYLRDTDPYKHLIKSSSSEESDGGWGKDFGDISDVHGYFGWSGTDGPKDLARFIYGLASSIKKAGLPYLISEVGLAREVQTECGLVAELADKDTTCVHVHECLWGGLFSGSCGSGMVWWWDEHIDLKDCYWRFKGIANFVKDVPLNRECFTVGEPHISHSDLRARELRGKSLCLVWIQNIHFTWWDTIQGTGIPTVSKAKLTLKDVQPGQYLIEWWDTKSGQITKTETLTTDKNDLEINVADIKTDIALKVINKKLYNHR